MIYWFFLMLAIIFETIATTSMKQVAIGKGYVFTILVILGYAISFVFLTLSMKKIDLSVSYAVWSGLGTTLIAIIGWWFFKETMDAYKISAIVLIIVGVVLLKLSH